jgi:hypothetical protein
MVRLAAVSLLALAGAFWVPAATAAEQSEAPRVARTDSLELPGLTAGCHVCEWRPKPNKLPAAEQCGTDGAGAARVGLFECGFSQDCQRECHFVSCEPQ